MNRSIFVATLVCMTLLGAGCNSSKSTVTGTQKQPPPEAPANVPYPTPVSPRGSQNDLCTREGEMTDIGRTVYPISEMYKQLPHLGQLFTAVDCGEERVKQLSGVKGNEYTLGARIALKDIPSAELIKVLKEIGFDCSTKSDEVSCQEWTLTESVTIQQLLKLKPFSSAIGRDDCVNCG